MKLKFFVSSFVIFSIWNSLFAPFISAQNNASGLQFRISEAAREDAARPLPTPAKPENLTQAETEAILRRLPEMRVETNDVFDFKMLSGSLKPPRAGKINTIKFSADETKNAPVMPTMTTKSLEVERFSPVGDVSLAPGVSVTFSQPMIAAQSQTEASGSIPVVLSPAAHGNWRWLGTQTLVFDAETRLPMATKFTATIPANTKSAAGGNLEKEVSWTFTTAAPKIEKFAPVADQGEIYPDYAIMAAKFNQEIDGKRILPKIAVYANGKRFPVRLVTDEVDESYEVFQRLGETKPKHWLAFRTIATLPLNAEIKVVFEKDLPSAEGVLTSEAEQIFAFKTLGDFRLSAFYCGYSQLNPPKCAPSDDFRLQFNRSLFPVKFDASLLKIEPPIENAKIETEGSHSSIYIRGAKKPNTKYKITLSGRAVDFYKLKIGKDVSATFNVGTEDPQFYASGENFVTLDPNGKRQFSLYSRNQTNFKVKLYRVMPEDYPNYRALLRDFYRNQNVVPRANFGALILDKTFEPNGETDELIETKIDLSKTLSSNFGHALLIAEPGDQSEEYDQRNMPIVVWIQATDIGIDAAVDDEKLIALATDLKTGKPLKTAAVSLNHDRYSRLETATNETGIAEFALPDAAARAFLVVKNGDDSAILRENNDYAEIVSDWSKKAPYDSLRWFVFDDRKMYRPNEEVSVKGYIRKITGGKLTDAAALGDEKKAVKYILRDAKSIEIAKGAAEINTFGAFDFKLLLPANINLGTQRLELTTGNFAGGIEFSHSFEVQEFRRPEFEVAAQVESSAPFFVGDSAIVSAEAKYYSGGLLQNAETNWTVAATPTDYTPPNRADFTFGKFAAWWKHSGENYRERIVQKFAGKTDADGKHRINLDFTAVNPARAYTVEAQANVQDVNRQSFAGSTALLVHPSELYVGIRTAKTFVRPGEKFVIQTITTDIDGKAVRGAPVLITAELRDWRKMAGSWQETLLDTQTCRITSAESVASCAIAAKQGGVFTIVASVIDRRTRRNESELTVWVAGGNTESTMNIEEETIEMIPDKKEYAANDTAEILINAPFYPAEGVMTLERGGIVKIERFTISENSKILRVPIQESYLPNVRVRVDLVGAAQRVIYEDERDAELAKRPAFASGELNLKVSTATRQLNVTAQPTEKTLAPGGETRINVEVKDHNGDASANTEVAIVAVDESVLALTNYEIGNPLDAFYTEIAANVEHFHSRENILLSFPDDVGFGMGSGSGSGDGMGSGRGASEKKVYRNWIKSDVAYIITEKNKDKIKIRRNFDALAIFSPSVVTDENGRATVDLKLPDNLTRYRITAVAVTKSKQFGLGESSITAKQSLQVRPSAPRFMNFGDEAELPVVIQNQTDREMTVNVAIRASNAILTNGSGVKVIIPPEDRAEIRFPVRSETAGTARFQIGAVSGEYADAAEIEFPVYTPATTETFATYGTTEANGAIGQIISAPPDVYSQFGGLEITTGSTQLQELTDAFIYLQNYPFECSEQISSRVLSVAALRDVLTAFEAKDLPPKEEIEAKMRFDIARLQKLQHMDGGYSFWRSDDASIPFVSVHVAHAVARAKAKGYAVPNELTAKSLGYLRNIETKLPGDYSEEARLAISAYAIYVRDLLGEKDAMKAKKLLTPTNADKLSPESLGWLLSVLTDDKNSAATTAAITTNLLNRVTETAGAAHFVADYKDGEYVLLASERRADGVILEALLKSRESGVVSSESENLIPKIVRGLLANRIKGRWQSTQENAFVLLALDKYFQTFEKNTPNFVAKIWLGNSYAGEQKFTGRTTDSNLINVPMSYLQTQNAAQNLIVDKQGDGRLYYRIGLHYAAKNLKSTAADYGFAVSREYQAMDKPEDVRRNADASWTIKSGARVRVNVQMIAPTRRYHVALVDNLPAGIEIINPELAVSGDTNLNLSRDLQRRSLWFVHQNLRDNRAEVFTMLLSEGVWNYSYLARATTPGSFVAPPAKAEEMYAPETFGRSATDFVRVE